MIIPEILSFVVLALILFLSIRLFYNYRELLGLKKLISITELQLLKEIVHQQALSKELTSVKAQFAHDVLYDSLTGLPGRQVFEDRLVQIINQSKRYQLHFGVLFLDLDGFKVINDALGHDVGDELLKEVGARMQASIRKVDSIGRFAGDEFIFILAQLSKPEAAVYVAQRLLNEITQPFKVRNHDLFITGSIGIAVYPNDGEDARTLLKNSDNALHQAKARGRNTYQFYREEMHALSHRELMLNSGLQQYDVYHNFLVFYQPQINVSSKKIVCFQALLHWQHPDFGLIPYNDFLQMAENNGKIHNIGEWTLRHALQQYLKWKKLHFELNQISIPTSIRQLEHPHFAYKISQLLQEMNIEPETLILEFSEVVLPTKLDGVEKGFHMLKHLGVQIAIRDFGAGHLALQQLKHFPIDYLKIANSLVQDITINKDSESIVKMIIALAHSLQITVVADGVESTNQQQVLKSLGCEIMEGSLFTQPLRAEECTSEKITSFLNA